MEKNPRGWKSLLENLRSDLDKIAPRLHITEINESPLGGLQVYYSSKGLTAQQAAAVDARVKRAEDAAWQTCRVCGSLGKPAWTTPPPMARVFCEAHMPKTWNSIE